MDLIAEELENHNLELLANRIGLHKSTLHAIRSGKTKWPRHTTMLTLIHALKLELWVKRS